MTKAGDETNAAPAAQTREATMANATTFAVIHRGGPRHWGIGRYGSYATREAAETAVEQARAEGLKRPVVVEGWPAHLGA